MPRSVGILGGGVAGLALCALLARRGHAVTLYEAGELGGKLRRVVIQGQSVDTGPSLFSFPGVWRRVLARLGEPDPLDWQALPGLGLHVVGKERFEVPVPPGHPLYPAWVRYLAEVAPLAAPVETLLVTPPRLLEPQFVRASAALGRVLAPHLTAQRWLRARALPPALHHALAVHALNAGVGPRGGSALYALLPGLIAHGLWRPRAGMYALVEALAGFARAHGAVLLPHTPVRRVDPQRAAVELEDGPRRHDLLVSALDPSRLAALLGQRVPEVPLTVSGVAMYAVTARALPLLPTTVVPPTDYAVFEAAMRARALPPDTLALIHFDAARRGLSLLLTAPASGGDLAPDHPWVRGQLRRLERLLSVSLEAELESAVTLSPAFYARGGATGGAIYGQALPAGRAGPFHPQPYRLGARLWQVGTGVHPGGGLPAVLGGALIVDELLEKALR